MTGGEISRSVFVRLDDGKDGGAGQRSVDSSAGTYG